ncbi:MAG TPA: kinase [Xanthomonadales bacterium]|nr:kinase [Xanthomonadales bacterium]
MCALLPELLGQLPRRLPVAICLAGPPGSGKSTLAAFLCEMLNHARLSSLVISLDHYYLPREERKHLAEHIHPLFMHRGVPGTHDWSRLVNDIDQLLDGKGYGLKTPVFDKSKDDRADRKDWRTISSAPSLVIVEGWCLGAPAQLPTELREPINELERTQDPDGRWRAAVNDHLGRYRMDLHQRISRFFHIGVPDWHHVIDWRWQQEQELAEPRLRNQEDVISFLGTFERIAKHMQNSAVNWTQVSLSADSTHRLHIMD